MRIDGSDKSKIDEGSCSGIHILGEWIYYHSENSNILIRNDGTERRIL